jgi:hypothetical protein
MTGTSAAVSAHLVIVLAGFCVRVVVSQAKSIFELRQKKLGRYDSVTAFALTSHM